MRKFILTQSLAMIMTLSIAVGNPVENCARSSIPIEDAIRSSREYVGEPIKAWLSYSKRSGSCLWKVRGTKGYIIIDGKNGEMVKFYRTGR